MQVDFREERRWKMALAYELALEVQEWHAAGSYEERIRLGICARWRRPDPLELEAINGAETMEVDFVPPLEHESEHRNPDPEEDMEDITAGLDTVLAGTESVLAPRRTRVLAPGTLSIERLRDANLSAKAEGEIKTVQFHPSAQIPVLLVASSDRRLRLYNVRR